MHIHDAQGKKNHLVLCKGELNLDHAYARAKESGCNVVLEAKTIEGLRQSVDWMRQKGYL